MIALDSSALMAIVQREPEEDACTDALIRERNRVISAVTLAEVLIVAERRGCGPQMEDLLQTLAPTVQPVSEDLARRAVAAYATWGKGVHPASLNFADCFAYVAARDHGCPLLYIGNDFARTDVESAL